MLQHVGQPSLASSREHSSALLLLVLPGHRRGDCRGCVWEIEFERKSTVPRGGDPAALRRASALTLGGLPVRNVPTLGLPLAACEVGGFATRSGGAGDRLPVREVLGCAPPAVGPECRVPVPCAQAAAARAREHGPGRGHCPEGPPWRPEVGAATGVLGPTLGRAL